jgi:signal transduction histidine kinase
MLIRSIISVCRRAQRTGLADEAIASRDDFLAMASHDLRNMLGGIALSAASLMNVRAEDEVRRAIGRDAQRIQRYTARMSRLVGDLLDVVSIEAGHLAVAPQRHEATELLRETQDIFQSVAAAKGISIRAEVNADSLLARYDHERILQVLANLVGNAIKFTPQGGRVDLLVEPVDQEIRFAVSDTGRGIAADQLHAMFERFWQSATKSDASGLGLGLHISRCIVEAHGGKIWAESRLGEGSTFYFTLPAAPSTSAAETSNT